MTTDVVINNIINELCQKFNVAASELVPRMQAYGMAMNKFGAIAAGVICVVLSIIAIVICKFEWDDIEFVMPFIIFAVGISIIILLYNIYTYIGWRYAPEVKTIEYITMLFRS